MRRFFFPAFLRRRWLWWLAGVLVSIPALVLALFYWWLLPNLPAYKDDVASLLSSATGYTITLEKLDGEWGGARPYFILEGVRVSRDNKPLLYFSRLDGRFGWRTLLTLEPRFHELFIEAPALTVRRARDGMFYVGGLRIDPNSTDTSFSDWLLKQGAVDVKGATVAWMDEVQDAPPLVMRDVSFRLQNIFTRHALELSMTPPAWLARPLAIKGVMHGRSLSARQDWHGTISLNVPALEVAAWTPWLPVEYANVRAHGGVEGNLSVYQGRLSATAFKLNLADVHMRLPQLDAPLALAKLAGEVGWAREIHAKKLASTAYVRKMNLVSRAGIKAESFDFSWRWGDSEQAVAARNLPLGQLATMAGEFPLSSEHKVTLRALALKGRIDTLKVDWSNQPASPLSMPDAFKIDVRFAGVGWAAEGNRPGAENLDGMLAGNQEKGVYLLSGKKAGFDLPAVFADPAVRFDSMIFRGSWKRHAAKGQTPQTTIEIAESSLSNADLSASLYGSYRLDAKGPGYADLNGKVARANGTRVQRYLPMVINADTHEWLRSSVLRGEVSGGSFKLQGDLINFPFSSTREGVFQVKAQIAGAQLRYADDYPMIEDINGEFIMDGIRLEVRSDKARIFGAQLRKVKAVIADYETSEELLEIDGEALGAASEFIRFVNFSPVTETIEGLTEEMTATGDMHLLLNLKVPLRHSKDTTAAGRLSFIGNTVFPGPEMPRLEQMNGQLDFTERSISAQKITARILGGAASASAMTENNQVRVRGQGVFQAAALEAWLGKDIASRLSGQAEWKGDLNLGGGKSRLRFDSNLVGLDSNLPAPLSKTAAKTAPFVFEQQAIDGGAKWSNLQYGSIASAVWTSVPSPAGFRLERGELRFGEKAKLPVEKGLQIVGYVNMFDLGGWVDILPDNQGQQQGVEISGINLTLSSLDFLNRRFHDITVNAKLRGNLLRANVGGKEMSGNLTYRRSGEGPTRLSAQFKHFMLPEPNLPPAQPGEAQAVQLDAASFPAFDLQVEDLKLGDQAIGRLEVIAHGVANGMAIDQLNLTHSDSVIRMSGFWKDSGKGETKMKVSGEIKDAGKLLARYGFADAIKRGTAQIDGDVTWQGSPADFAFKTLDGTLKLSAKNGQFLKVNPGAGKLLGIASLQSLPRRITLDFRDVFSDGFAFDDISSTMQLAKGDLYTHDFLMKGPAATVKMSGVARLQNETVKLRVKVIPKLSEGVAVAGALLGGPLAGLGALVVQKVLKDPFEEAISFEYLVDGDWENPTVTRLAKPKTEKEPES